MCANQRKKGKKNVGAWISEELYDQLKRESSALGITMSDYITLKVEEGIKNANKKG